MFSATEPSLAWLLLIAAPFGAVGEGGAFETPAGVVVEGVASGSAAEKVGIQPGDVIVAWSRAAVPPANPEPAEGTIASPFGVHAVGIEQAPRGPVTLRGSRGDDERSWALPPGALGLTVR